MTLEVSGIFSLNKTALKSGLGAVPLMLVMMMKCENGARFWNECTDLNVHVGRAWAWSLDLSCSSFGFLVYDRITANF